MLAILMVATSFLGKEAYITASGLHGLRFVKSITPSRASPMTSHPASGLQALHAETSFTASSITAGQ
jgi:hypothetical protein